jgi:hypothetical protein
MVQLTAILLVVVLQATIFGVIIQVALAIRNKIVDIPALPLMVACAPTILIVAWQALGNPELVRYSLKEIALFAAIWVVPQLLSVRFRIYFTTPAITTDVHEIKG